MIVSSSRAATGRASVPVRGSGGAFSTAATATTAAAAAAAAANASMLRNAAAAASPCCRLHPRSSTTPAPLLGCSWHRQHHYYQQQQQSVRGVAAAATSGGGDGDGDDERGSSGKGAAADAATVDSALAGSAAAPSSADLVKALARTLPQVCCGCGVRLQSKAEDLPGFYRVPRKLLDWAAQKALLLGLEEDGRGSGSGGGGSGGEGGDDAGLDADERRRRALDRAAEEWLDEQRRPRAGGVVGAAYSDADGEDGPPGVDVLCERCYGLKHQGRVKRPGAEALLPDFDLAKKVGRKIALQRDRRALVLVVVDVADFDGSLPRSALR